MTYNTKIWCPFLHHIYLLLLLMLNNFTQSYVINFKNNFKVILSIIIKSFLNFVNPHTYEFKSPTTPTIKMHPYVLQMKQVLHQIHVCTLTKPKKKYFEVERNVYSTTKDKQFFAVKKMKKEEEKEEDLCQIYELFSSK